MSHGRGGSPVKALAQTAAAAAKEHALGLRLRLHVLASAALGAAASSLSAVLIAYAILDIERQLWAQWLYTIVYATSACVFGSSAGAELLPDACVRRTVVCLCMMTATLSHRAAGLLSAPRALRVLGLAALGTGLGASLLLSTLVLLRLCLEMRGVLPAGGAMEEGPLNAKQLLLLSLCALLEGAYFGLAIGLLEEGRALALVALPHEAPAVVFPLAAALGAACGAAVERLRQSEDSAYVRGLELRVLGGGGEGAVEGEEAALLGAADEEL